MRPGVEATSSSEAGGDSRAATASGAMEKWQGEIERSDTCHRRKYKLPRTSGTLSREPRQSLPSGYVTNSLPISCALQGTHKKVERRLQRGQRCVERHDWTGHSPGQSSCLVPQGFQQLALAAALKSDIGCSSAELVCRTRATSSGRTFQHQGTYSRTIPFGDTIRLRVTLVLKQQISMRLMAKAIYSIAESASIVPEYGPSWRLAEALSFWFLENAV